MRSKTRPLFLSVAVDGGWSDYGPWRKCSSSCGEGFQERMRTCTNPPPSRGGAQCSGSHKEFQKCNDGPCPGNKLLRWLILIHNCESRDRCNKTETLNPREVSSSENTNIIKNQTEQGSLNGGGIYFISQIVRALLYPVM